MQFNKQFLIISIVVVVLALLGWRVAAKAGWFSPVEETGVAAEGSKKDKMDNSFKSLNKKVGGKETPITVEAAPAIRGDLIQTVSAQGRVHAYQQLDVIAEVPGRLTRLGVKDGSNVKKGQVIAAVDDREYQLAVREAKATLLEAKANYLEYDTGLATEQDISSGNEALANLDKQLKDGLLSKEQYDRKSFRLELKELRSGTKRDDVISAKFLEKAEVNLMKAQINLEKCKILAPFSGTIFGVAVSEGELISGSTKLAILVNMTDLVVKAQVLESEIGQVEKGRPARVRFTALPDLEESTGKVQAVSPIVNEENKTVETILAISSKDGRIRPGMFAETKIDAKIFEDRLMVAKTAILPRDNRKVVFKVSPESRAKWIYVSTGVENDEFVEIIKGDLAPGDMVLTDNHFTMGHDTLVKIAKKKKK